MGTMGAGGGDCDAMRAELRRPGFKGGRGNSPPGWGTAGAAAWTTGAALTVGLPAFTALALTPCAGVEAGVFNTGWERVFGMVLITDFVSGLADLPEAPVFAGTGWATAFLLAAGTAGLLEGFFAAGLTTTLAALTGAAFFGAGRVAAAWDAAAGLTKPLTVG